MFGSSLEGLVVSGFKGFKDIGFKGSASTGCLVPGVAF